MGLKIFLLIFLSICSIVSLLAFIHTFRKNREEIDLLSVLTNFFVFLFANSFVGVTRSYYKPDKATLCSTSFYAIWFFILLNFLVVKYM